MFAFCLVGSVRDLGPLFVYGTSGVLFFFTYRKDLLLSENEFAFGHSGDRNQEVLEGDDFFCRDDVVTDVQALDAALFEGIRQLFDVIHDD